MLLLLLLASLFVISGATIATTEHEYYGYSLFVTRSPSALPSRCEEWRVNSVTGERWWCCPKDVVVPQVVRVVHDDVGVAMAAQRQQHTRSDTDRAATFFDAFRTEPEITTQLQQWASMYPARVTLASLPTMSVEGRSLWHMTVAPVNISGT
jgi:hypothetical protein